MRILTSLFLFLALTSQAFAQAGNQPQWAMGDEIVNAQLIAQREVTAPGDSFHLGLEKIIPEGWHTYWRNPGDFGQPMELEWTLPDGVTIGEPIWPLPIELELAEGEIMDYGYYDQVVLPLPITISEDFTGSVVDMTVEAYWQVCEVICVPEERTLTFSLPVGDTPSDHAEDFWNIQAGLEAEPQPADNIEAVIEQKGEYIVLELTGEGIAEAASWRNAKFLPFDNDLIAHAIDPQVSTGENGELYLAMQTSFKLDDGVGAQRGGLLVIERDQGAGIFVREGVEIQAVAGETSLQIAPPVADVQPVGVSGLFSLLLFALLGGLILNLMPCVFPILSIKVLKFVETAYYDPMRVRRHGLYFLAGVVLSFVALAALLVGLREVGLPVGWGFQLQVPVVVAALTVLLFGIGLNLLGVFEVGTSIQGLGSDLAEAPGGRGAFFTGVLAVVVAAPCVGPLAAGALGLALTQPAIIVLAVAAAMGVGLALPFVIFTFAPNLLKLLPRPGVWMETFKQFLAFPMFAAALWLIWVLSLQTGATGVLFIGMALLAFGFGVWALGRGGIVWRGIGALGLVMMLVATLWVARLPDAGATMSTGNNIVAWSQSAVDEAQAEGQPVFIDVTAAWCVTCQVNKVRVLNDQVVIDAFAEADFVVMQADWTNRDDDITQLIYENGQAGVPLYLVYPADGGPAQVLPAVLTRSIVLDAIEVAAG